MSAVLRMIRIISSALLVVSLAAGRAGASGGLGPLTAPAVTVVNPARTLLIGIARAGARLVAVGAHGVIVYSDDNGRNWKQAAVPTSETMTCVAFADAKDGWAAGGQGVILHSGDAGQSWHLQLTGDQVIPLMSDAAGQLAAAKPVDVGAMRAVHRAGIFAAAGANKPFLSILPLGGQSAIIFGAYRMTVRTDDGGKSWTDWSLRVGDPVSHNIYDSARVDASIYLDGESGVVLRSDDQGQSFSMLPSPDPSTMFGVLGTQKGTVLTFGVAGEVFRSSDQGKSWAQAAISANSDLTGGIVLHSGTIVLISEIGGVFESTDDGLTFRNVPLNIGMAPFGLIQAANGDVVFVGSNGVRVEPAASFNG